MHRSRRRGAKMADFAALPRAYYCTAEYRSLSLGARALLIEFALKFNGKNNGNLEMTAEQAHVAGIGSRQTFHKFKTELINAGWLIVTRQGGICNRCNLYALSYRPIDDTGKQYDHPWKPALAPLHLWKEQNADQRDTRREPTPRRRLEQMRGAGPSLVATN